MKYFLFVNFNNGLMHNAVHKTLGDVLESVKQLICDEGLSVKRERLPNVYGIEKYLNKNDDYFGQLANGTWYYIQPQNIFEVIK
ncbi:MAG: hypothetical protein AAB925_02170 [Patescibacteria group bacterium]